MPGRLSCSREAPSLLPSTSADTNAVHTKEPIGGNYKVEEVVRLHARRKPPIIYQRGAYGQRLVVGKAFDLLGNVVYNFVSNLFASLDFNYNKRALGLDEEVNLASAMTLRWRLNVWKRR